MFSSSSLTAQEIKCKGIFWVVYSLPWIIAYFVIYQRTEDYQCRGRMLDYALFAQWSYLAQIVLVFITIPVGYYFVRRVEVDDSKRAETVFNMFGFVHLLLMLATWVYAIIALVDRDKCNKEPLVDLVWATVLTPASLLVCCGSCCLLFYGTGFNVFKRDRAIGGNFEKRYSFANRDIMHQLAKINKDLESQMSKTRKPASFQKRGSRKPLATPQVAFHP